LLGSLEHDQILELEHLISVNFDSVLLLQLFELLNFDLVLVDHLLGLHFFELANLLDAVRLILILLFCDHVIEVDIVVLEPVWVLPHRPVQLLKLFLCAVPHVSISVVDPRHVLVRLAISIDV
jgi:hypothetical protein